MKTTNSLKLWIVIAIAIFVAGRYLPESADTIRSFGFMFLAGVLFLLVDRVAAWEKKLIGYMIDTGSRLNEIDTRDSERHNRLICLEIKIHEMKEPQK